MEKRAKVSRKVPLKTKLFMMKKVMKIRDDIKKGRFENVGLGKKARILPAPLEDGYLPKNINIMGRMTSRSADPSKQINGVTEQPQWRRISIAVDSGACDNVIDPSEVPDVLLVPTVDSLAGNDFTSATGSPIRNLGELQVPMLTRAHTLRGMVFQ